MKKLILRDNKYGLRVYCTKCGRNLNHKIISKCKHPEKQSYKSIVYVNNNTKVKHHKTRDFDEALKLAIQFKRDVKDGVFDNLDRSIEMLPNRLSIVDSANKYLNYKNGIGVYDFEKKDYDKDYLSGIRLYIQQFVDVLRENGYNIYEMPISELRRKHVAPWWDYIMMRYSSKWSQHATLRAMRAWINHAINYQEVEMRNPFKDVKCSLPKAEIITISKNEFDKVCEAVESADPYRYLGGKTTKRKNMYKPYLVDAFKLGLYTGLRREELVALKWSDIHFEESTGGYIIKTNNLKVERITGKSYKPKFIPIYKQLKDLLNELGWHTFKDTNHYIIEPFREVGHQTMMDAISKGFSHYYKKAFPKQPIKQLKTLRKTYLSYLEKAVGENIIQLSSHGDKTVLERHYVDPAVVAKGYEMSLF